MMNQVALGIVVKDQKVLLVNRRFPPKFWGPPGGLAEPGEAMEAVAKRETWEETGITCEVIEKIYEFVYEDSNVIVYACRYISGDLECSYESLELGWFELDQMPQPFSPEIEVFKQAIDIASQIRSM